MHCTFLKRKLQTTKHSWTWQQRLTNLNTTEDDWAAARTVVDMEVTKINQYLHGSHMNKNKHSTNLLNATALFQIYFFYKIALGQMKKENQKVLRTTRLKHIKPIFIPHLVRQSPFFFHFLFALNKYTNRILKLC